MKSAYLDTIQIIERMHRQCLELIKAELDREGFRDINNVQALILFNIGDEELTVGELTQRGYYLGSNVSYNVKKLVENGYLTQQRSRHDRRSSNVRASERGREICRLVDQLFERHVGEIGDSAGVNEADLRAAVGTLDRVFRFWSAPRHLSMRA